MPGMRSEPSPRTYELQAPVWYRTSRDTEWRTGVSRHVSTTSAIIQSDDPPSPSDEITVVIELSASGCLVGRGRVVLESPSTGAGLPASFAIAVDQFSIEHRESILHGYTPVLHGC
jgi:hypothetical protein